MPCVIRQIVWNLSTASYYQQSTVLRWLCINCAMHRDKERHNHTVQSGLCSCKFFCCTIGLWGSNSFTSA